MNNLQADLNKAIEQLNAKRLQVRNEMIEMLAQDDEGFERLYIAHEKTLDQEKALKRQVKRIQKQIKDGSK